MSVVKSVSMEIDDAKYLEDQQLGVSQFVRYAIEKHREAKLQLDHKREIEKLEKEIQIQEDKCSLMLRFIQSKNLFDDYRGFKNALETPKENGN
jgi:hypothetical protein